MKYKNNNGYIRERHAKGLKLLKNGHMHSVFYVHKVLGGVKQLEEKNIFRVKPGISILPNKEKYFSQRGTNELVGKDMKVWNQSFLDQSLTWDEAKAIINLTDRLFKNRMIQLGKNSRDIHGSSIKSTEAVESNISYEHIINECVQVHEQCYKIAYEKITKKTFSKDIIEKKPFKYRNGQDEYFVTPLVNKFISLFKTGINLVKLSAKAPGGSGKTFLSYMTGWLLSRHFKTPFKVFGVGNSVPQTIQLVNEFSKFYEIITGKRLLNIHFIGSDPDRGGNFMLNQAWAESNQAANTNRVRDILKDFSETREDYAIFVVNKSTSEVIKICKENNITFDYTFKFLDEIQQYSSESGTPKSIQDRDTQIINTKNDFIFKNSFALSVSATPINRGVQSSQDIKAVFNSDIDRFGELEVDISYQLARELGWNCDLEMLIAPIPLEPEIADAYENNDPVGIILEDQSYRMRPSIFLGSEAINFAIADNRTHILLLSTWRDDVEDLTTFLKARQEAGYLSKEYTIMGGLSEKANYVVNTFNKHEKVILVANRWIGVGHDTVECDCIIPLYIPGNQWYLEQLVMRSLRIKKDNRGALLVYIGPEEVENPERTWNNPIWNFIESNSNGIPAKIISSADFREPAEPRVIGGTRNPNEGIAHESNVRIIRNNNSNPVAFLQYETAASYCIQSKWTNEDGTSNWLDLFGNNIKYNKEFLIEECKKFNSERELNQFYNDEGVAVGMCMKAAIRRFDRKYPGFKDKVLGHMWDYQLYNHPKPEHIAEILDRFNIKKVVDLMKLKSSSTNKSGSFYYYLISDLDLTVDDFFDKPFQYTKFLDKITEEMLSRAFTSAASFSNISDFRENDSGALIFLKRFEILESATAHMDRPYNSLNKKQNDNEQKYKEILPVLNRIKKEGGYKRGKVKSIINDSSLYYYLYKRGLLKGVIKRWTGKIYTEHINNVSGDLSSIVKQLNLSQRTKYIKGYIARAADKGTIVTDKDNPLFGLHFTSKFI